MTIQLRFTTISLALCLALLFAADSPAQDPQDERDTPSTEKVTQSRRPGRQTNPTKKERYRVKQPVATRPEARPTPKPPSPVPQFPVKPPPAGHTYITLGVTLWRVRRATAEEIQDLSVPKERMVLGPKEPETAVVVERISDENPITPEDFLQISVEYLPYRHESGQYLAKQVAYLYVVNREETGAGVRRNARLIFPTNITNRGDNRVLPGHPITLPDSQRPFRLWASEPVQAFETYTFIVSPEPLDNDLPQAIGQEMDLSANLVEKWERQWGGAAVRADLAEGIYRKRTPQEKSAGERGTGDTGANPTQTGLTQDDPEPQIVFRKVVQPGATMLVTIKLPFKN